jgi:hypothetical protein
MWSLTSPRAERISGPEKFRSSARKDFFNSICHQQTSRTQIARKKSRPKATSQFKSSDLVLGFRDSGL